MNGRCAVNPYWRGPRRLTRNGLASPYKPERVPRRPAEILAPCPGVGSRSASTSNHSGPLAIKPYFGATATPSPMRAVPNEH